MDIKNIENIEKHWVCFSNRLVETSFNMTTVEQKLIRIIASMIKKDDEEFKRYNFRAIELSKYLKISNKNIYRELEKISKRLMTRYVKLKVDDDTWEMYHIIRAVRLKNGVLSMEIDSEMKDFYLFLGAFTRYRLKDILNFSCAHSFKIYEFLKCNEFLKTKEIELDVLKEYLEVSDKYKTYYDFRKRVLLSVQADINENTDINFEFEEIKNGRRILAIKCIINKTNRLNDAVLDGQMDVVKTLNKMGKEEIEKIVNDFSSKYNLDLDYYLIKRLVDEKGIEHVKKCVTEIKNYVTGVTPQIFFDFTKKYGTSKAYTKTGVYNNTVGAKPIQALNYEQREYDQDFFDSLYDNVDLTKKA